MQGGRAVVDLTYVNIKSQDGVLLARPLQAGDFDLKLVLRHMLPWLGLRLDVVISRRLRPSVLLYGTSRLFWLMLLFVLLPMLLRLWRRVGIDLVSVLVLLLLVLLLLVLMVVVAKARGVVGLLYGGAGEVMMGYGVAVEALTVGVWRARPRRRASAWVVHRRARDAAVAVGSLEVCAFAGAALEAEVGGDGCLAPAAAAVAARGGSGGRRRRVVAGGCGGGS